MAQRQIILTGIDDTGRPTKHIVDVLDEGISVTPKLLAGEEQTDSKYNSVQRVTLTSRFNAELDHADTPAVIHDSPCRINGYHVSEDLAGDEIRLLDGATIVCRIPAGIGLGFHALPGIACLSNLTWEKGGSISAGRLFVYADNGKFADA